MNDIQVARNIYMREPPTAKLPGKFYVTDNLGCSQWPIRYQGGRIAWDNPEQIKNIKTTEQRLNALLNVTPGMPGMWYSPWPTPVCLTKQGAAWGKHLKLWQFSKSRPTTVVESIRYEWINTQKVNTIYAQMRMPWLNLWEYRPFYENLENTNDVNFEWSADYDMARVKRDILKVGADLFHEVWGKQFGPNYQYWNELYSLEPWHELEMESNAITHYLLTHHLTFFGQHTIGYRLNADSPINGLLMRYAERGIHTDMLINLYTVLQTVVDTAMWQDQNQHDPRWFVWEEIPKEEEDVPYP